MWKIIIFSAFLIAVQGANIADIYGHYMAVNMYPSTPGVLGCLNVTFAEDSQKTTCHCSDGKDVQQVYMESVVLYDSLHTHKSSSEISAPIMAVDSVDNNLESLMDVNCTCAGKQFDVRGVAKTVNKEYLLVYLGHPVGNHVTHTRHRKSFLLAKQLPHASEVEGIIALFDELKGKKRGSTICTKEILEQFQSKQ